MKGPSLYRKRKGNPKTHKRLLKYKSKKSPGIPGDFFMP